jgi:hypothetical protein
MASNKSEHNKARLISAMARHLSNVSNACQDVGLARRTFYEYKKKDSEFAAQLDKLAIGENGECSELSSALAEARITAKQTEATLDALGKLGATEHLFTLSEREFEDYVLENLERIALKSGWATIRRVERQFRIPIAGSRYARVDIMVWHVDGTGTVIECKVPTTASTYELYSIGQLMLYASVIKTQMGQYPRLVMCAPSISPMYYRIVKEFQVPINLLQIDNDECVYLS